jgi:hypothetical protein
MACGLDRGHAPEIPPDDRDKPTRGGAGRPKFPSPSRRDRVRPDRFFNAPTPGCASSAESRARGRSGESERPIGQRSSWRETPMLNDDTEFEERIGLRSSRLHAPTAGPGGSSPRSGRGPDRGAGTGSGPKPGDTGRAGVRRQSVEARRLVTSGHPMDTTRSEVLGRGVRNPCRSLIRAPRAGVWCRAALPFLPDNYMPDIPFCQGQGGPGLAFSSVNYYEIYDYGCRKESRGLALLRLDTSENRTRAPYE